MAYSIYPKASAGVERFAPILLAAVLGLALAGCKTTQPTEPTASLGAPAARLWPAGAGRCRARTGLDPAPEESRRARRLRARACRRRQLQTGARRAQSCPYAR